jgi:S1-C subfamily serine protease
MIGRLVQAFVALAALSVLVYGAVTVSREEIEKRVVGPSVQVVSPADGEGKVSGSGVVFKTKKGVYILTAGHVVENAVSVKTDWVKEGEASEKEVKKRIFQDVFVVVQRMKEDVVTAELRVRCKVVYYKPTEEEGGCDLAVLEPYEPDMFQYGARPLPADKKVYAGQPCYHVGSLLGELVNSVTFGVISSPVRMYKNAPFIQLSSPAQPGSSGGGIFVVDDDGKCYYAGMLTRGTGETINLAVPLGRIRKALTEADLLYVLDEAE